jgi:hypothetical protein
LYTAHRGVGVAVRSEHDDLADRLLADRLVEQVGKVVAVGLERGGATREVRDRHRRPKEDSVGCRADQVEDVAAVAVHATHCIDEVGALEAVTFIEAVS